MKLQFQTRDFCCAALIALFGIFLVFSFFMRQGSAFADEENAAAASSEHFITIYDQGSVRTVKSATATVAEVLEGAAVEIAETDIVEPALDETINGDYNINIYRARPAFVVDGVDRRFVMTASYDPKQIAIDTGLTVYDGDIVTTEFNNNFLEMGAASTYKIERSGGRTLTVEETIAYTTETRYDYNLAKGQTVLEQAGSDGRRSSVYEIQFENNVEVSRTLLSETVILEPVPEIITVGAKVSIPPEYSQCASWAREAGVAEENLEAAIDLIYRESGCRVDATNPSSGAYGIPQSLPGSKMAAFGSDWETNPVTQIRWMENYVVTRYGGWQQALDFWWCTGACSNRNGTITKNGYWY